MLLRRCACTGLFVTSRATPALLCDATFYGTLAAVRSLGRAGVPVNVVDPGYAAVASWSRYATTRLRGPAVARADLLVPWLVELGVREGRHVVYPTSDEMVFLLSAHRDELARSFALFQPDLETTMRVLDKKQLLIAAADAGMETPQTWFPQDAADVERAARDADGPLLFKPRTQLFLRNHSKGALAPAEPSRLREAYETFCARNVYGPPVSGGMDYLAGPMLQRYYPEAAEGIYSLTGFRDRSGRHLPLLGSVKILQRPRRLGIGLCFESAPVPDDLRARATRLLDGLGYFGVFELEFIRSHGRYLLIDMNPRLYNQIQLDVTRGLDLPLLAYAAAVGDDDRVTRLAGLASSDGVDRVFCNRIGLGVLLGAQRLFGSMTSAEASRWRTWTRDHEGVLVDPIAADDDPGPTVAEGMGQVHGCLRHPRAFMRMIALER
jgi:D-aspartate ligase